MYYVYIIKSSTGRRYIGYTSNLQQRLGQHNRKHHVFSNNYADWEYEIYRPFETKEEAMKMERFLKSMKNYRRAIEYLQTLPG